MLALLLQCVLSGSVSTRDSRSRIITLHCANGQHAIGEPPRRVCVPARRIWIAYARTPGAFQHSGVTDTCQLCTLYFRARPAPEQRARAPRWNTLIEPNYAITPGVSYTWNATLNAPSYSPRYYMHVRSIFYFLFFFLFFLFAST